MDSISKNKYAGQLEQISRAVGTTSPELSLILLTVCGAIHGDSLKELAGICKKHSEKMIEELNQKIGDSGTGIH